MSASPEHAIALSSLLKGHRYSNSGGNLYTLSKQSACSKSIVFIFVADVGQWEDNPVTFNHENIPHLYKLLNWSYSDNHSFDYVSIKYAIDDVR